jgi:hypothetical protein
VDSHFSNNFRELRRRRQFGMAGQREQKKNHWGMRIVDVTSARR